MWNCFCLVLINFVICLEIIFVLSPFIDGNVKVNRLLFDKSLFSFQVKSLMQSKEELERCIKEQEVSKDVSLPKTDDLVDEVALHLIYTHKPSISSHLLPGRGPPR